MDADDFDVSEQEVENIENSCDPDLNELCNIMLDENNWEMPDNPEEAVQLYLNLRNIFKNVL